MTKDHPLNSKRFDIKGTSREKPIHRKELAKISLPFPFNQRECIALRSLFTRSPRTPAETPELYTGSEENSNSDASVVPSIDSLALEGFNVLTDKVSLFYFIFLLDRVPCKVVLGIGIRIRIRQSQVRIRLRILPSSNKNNKKNLDFY
jgi:hypothetical protein